MASKKRPSEDGAAEAEVHPEVVVTIEESTPEQPTVVMVEAAAPEEPGKKAVLEWAQEKGHVPVKKVIRFRGDAIHSGKHVDVICAHTQWPKNKLVSEQEYDEAADAAYSISVGEDLGAQKSRLEAANARAEAAEKTNAAKTAEGQ